MMGSTALMVSASARPRRSPSSQPVSLRKGCASPLTVHGLTRNIVIKIASEPSEWEDAFRLVRTTYLESGYESPSPKLLRFTPYHALPDTTVFIAKHRGRVVATFTLVQDNEYLGLPMESLYGAEVEGLRQAGRRLAEVTSLASDGLTQREFLRVFTAMIRLMKQFFVRQGGDTWVITVNPRHRTFYRKALGYVPLGPCRAYEAVEGHPAEAFWVDCRRMAADAPKMYAEVFGEPLPEEALTPVPMPDDLMRQLADESSQTDVQTVGEIIEYVETKGSPRCW